MIVRPVEPGDLADLHALYSDPRVWTHYPALRHTERAQTEELLDRWLENWSFGLGQWTILTDDGAYVGHCGAQLLHDRSLWNVGYRIRPEFWRRGITAWAARRAVDAAHEAAPERPVIAYMLEHNVGSWRTAERIGLRRVWSGPDAGNPDPTAVRLLYADRDLTPEVVATITAV